MKTIHSIPYTVALVCAIAGAAHAQTPADLQVFVRPYMLRADGGETPVFTSLATGPLVIGRVTTGTFSFGDACGAFSVSAKRGDVIENASMAWNVELTPIRVAGDAVTLRLRWVRLSGLQQQFEQVTFENNKGFRVPGEDIELTLRPGESWPIDSVPVPPGTKKSVEGWSCGPTVSLRVLVNHHPTADQDRRLVAADLWLIERLADGTEVQRGQLPTLRGVPNNRMRFFFDILVDGAASLDIYGSVMARIESSALAVSLETRSRWDKTAVWRSVDSTIQVKPDETIEVRLPKPDQSAGPFANRDFSIRIRARQLR